MQVLEWRYGLCPKDRIHAYNGRESAPLLHRITISLTKPNALEGRIVEELIKIADCCWLTQIAWREITHIHQSSRWFFGLMAGLDRIYSDLST